MTRYTWIALVGALWLTSAHAASFNCAKALSAVEKSICASATLSKLDDDLNKSYKAALSDVTDSDAAQLVRDQKQWLTDTRNACTDEACLQRVYGARITALKTYSDGGAPLLTRLDTLDTAAIPIGFGFPDDITQIDGDLVFSRYDENGNTRSVVGFDFTTGKTAFLVQGKPNPLLVALSQRYAVINAPKRFMFGASIMGNGGGVPFVLEIIDRSEAGSTRKMMLANAVADAHIDGDRLILLHGANSYGQHLPNVSVVDLPTLKVVQRATIEGQVIAQSQIDKIVTVYTEVIPRTDKWKKYLIVYDLDFKELGRVLIPPPTESLNLNCNPGNLTQEGDRLIVSTSCGDIQIISLKNFSIEHTIPRYANFYSLAVYDGLIFTTTEQQNGVVVYNVTTGKEVARLPIAASYLFAKGDVLLAAGKAASTGHAASWKMRTYRINPPAGHAGTGGG